MTGRFVNPALNPKLIDLLQNRPAQLAGSRGHAYVIRINSVCIVIYIIIIIMTAFVCAINLAASAIQRHITVLKD